MFALTFETRNAAFRGDEDELVPDEVAFILCHVAGLVSEGYTSGPIHDSNGNAVGSWTLNDA